MSAPAPASAEPAHSAGTGPRRSYEAHVLLVPLGADAAGLQPALIARGLDGVMTVSGVTPAAAPDDGVLRWECRPLAEYGWRPAAQGLAPVDLVAGADMVVLLATDLAEVPAELCGIVADAARATGALVAALVVGSRHWDTDRGRSAMAAMRAAVDMLVVVRSIELAAPFLDVLRGGPRAPLAIPDSAGP